jgi:hypothetical protein
LYCFGFGLPFVSAFRTGQHRFHFVGEGAFAAGTWG